MTDFQTALRNGIRGALCTYLQIGRNLYWAYSRAIPAANIGYGVTSAAHRFFCNREPPTQYTGEPASFSGGQCATYYALTINSDRVTTPGGVTESVTDTKSSVFGPISSIKWEDFPSENALKLVIRAAYIPGSTDGTAAISTLNKSFYSSATVTSVTVTRQDSLADNCGDPPPDPPDPPDNSTTNITVNYTDNSGNNVNVPVYLVFAPFILNAKAELTIPIRIAFNNTFSPSFNGTANFSTGDINFNFGNPNTSGNDNECEPTPDNYDTPDGDVDIPPDVPTADPIPPRDDPQPDTKGVIRAVIATVTEVPVNATEIFQDDNPNILIPRAGNVQFLVQVGNRIAWTTDEPIRNRRHFIPCPWEGGAIDVKATPAEGYSVSLTRIYANSQYPVSLLQ